MVETMGFVPCLFEGRGGLATGTVAALMGDWPGCFAPLFGWAVGNRRHYFHQSLSFSQGWRGDTGVTRGGGAWG